MRNIKTSHAHAHGHGHGGQRKHHRHGHDHVGSGGERDSSSLSYYQFNSSNMTSSHPQKMTSSEGEMKKVVKMLEQIQVSKPKERLRKIESLIYNVVMGMKKYKYDTLFQSTAIWTLINVANFDKIHVTSLLTRAGVQILLYDILKGSCYSSHTKNFASELCDMICSGEIQEDGEEMSSQEFNVFNQGSIDKSTSLYHDEHSLSEVSGIASFSPYYIDDKNAELISHLFDHKGHGHGEAIHRPPRVEGGSLIAGVHLENDFDFIEEHSKSDKTLASSLDMSEFWEKVNEKHVNKQKKSASGNRLASLTVSPPIPNRPRNKLKYAKRVDLAIENKLHVSYGRNIQSAPAGESIIPPFLAHLDPLTINLSTTLHSLGQRDRILKPIVDTIEEHEDGGQAGESAHFTERLSSNSLKKSLKAEKLSDIRFLQRFFVENATIKDTQTLIWKMQDMLELLDTQKSGKVPWKSFSRVMMALAPAHLMRSDVVSFLEAQVDDSGDMVDYREFLITGKLMILESKDNVKDVLARSWYKRQREGISPGEDAHTTYTWKHHVEWYRKRKADAVIWLMRRANRAIQYETFVRIAASYLLLVGKRSKALGDLIEAGDRSLQAIDAAGEARHKLMLRCVHARQWKTKRNEAQRFLALIAAAEIQRMIQMGDQGRPSMLHIKREPSVKLIDGRYITTNRINQPKDSRLYELKFRRDAAMSFLRAAADRAMTIYENHIAAFNWLVTLGEKCIKQEVVLKQVQADLVTIGDRARDHCSTTDAVLLSLLRIGQAAYVHLENQISSLNYLINKGNKSIIFVEKKEETYDWLSNFAQSHLIRLNRREEAFGHLVGRCKIANDLVRRRAEAVQYLQSIPQRIWSHESTLCEAHDWLKTRADKAIDHVNKCYIAFKALKAIAQRSTATTRKAMLAYADLRQIGFYARRVQFEKMWVPLPGNKDRLKDEIKRIVRSDKVAAYERQNMHEEERWKIELMDAFVALVIAYSGTEWTTGGEPAHVVIERSKSRKNVVAILEGAEEEERIEIGRLGFKQLILDGKLLGLPKGTADSCYEGVDSDGSGCVSFEEVWTWFLHQAKIRSRQKPGSVKFRMSDIISAKDRALVALMKRFSRPSSTSERSMSVKDDVSAYDIASW